MEVQFGPNSLDIPNLLYKLQRKIKVFNTNNPLPNRGYNLVATSSKYAIVFVASPDGTLSTYYLSQLIDKECEAQHTTIPLPEKPSHIAVSCDQELLAVTGGQLLCIYKVTDFQSPNVAPSVSMKCDVNPATFVSALQWNPCVPDTIAMAFYDGTLLASQVTTGQINKVPSKARCICWSPKGKQLVTGNSDGTLCQYKPNLTPAKTVPAPNLFGGAPIEALAIYWISTFQFAVVYKNATDNSRPAVTIVNIPKAGTPMCLNYEDVCYSMGSNRPWYYFLQGVPQWNIILASSSNSMEIGTLGSADGANWQQWCQADEARPELPLTDKKIENYPIGLCIDTCAIHQLPWGENDILPHMPLLVVVSQTGLLSIFNMINLNQQAGLCTPPQPLALPAPAMTAEIPGEQTPAPQQPKPEPVQTPTIVQPTPVAAIPAFGSLSATVKPFQQLQMPQPVSAAPLQIPVQPVDVKPAVVPVAPQAQVLAKPTPTIQVPQPQPPTVSPEVSAALKAEQKRANKMKENQEMREMLIKEVNDFQMELYKFKIKTRETQAKLESDIMTYGVPRLEKATFNLQATDTEQLKRDCSLEELRAAIVQLKLELVRACAVVAEARTHAEAKDCLQWTQVDPLTSKRVSTIKKLAYYVQNQVDHAQKSLDYKWNEFATRDIKMAKPGQRMIRPILDDVYQPLVKQQEILGRQQAVLRTLRNTMKECEVTPIFKSTSLLRSTPFRNKDPLSKLTKNILNMSIEPETKPKEPLLNAQKLDALRDMLSNHKTVKIKPVNVEMRQRLATMKINYEKSLREKADQTVHIVEKKIEPKLFTDKVLIPKVESPSPMKPVAPIEAVKIEVNPEIKQSPISIPSFTPVCNIKPAMPSVARTLFTDDPIPEPIKPAIQPIQPPLQTPQAPAPMVKPQQSFTFTAPTVTANTRSVLKDLLQNKQTLADAKNDSNTFMGQKICTPSVFSAPVSTSPPAAVATSTIFTAKPISDINNMFSKFQPHSFVTEAKPTGFAVNLKPQSSETGEIETPTVPVLPKFDTKTEEKPITNLFAMKPTPLSTSSQNVPDVLNVTQKSSKSVEKIADKLKENVSENVTSQKVESKTEVKPLAVPAFNKTIFGSAQPSASGTVSKSIFGSSQPAVSIVSSPVTSEAQKPIEAKAEIKPEVKQPVPADTTVPTTPTSASLFAAANASAPPTPPLVKPQPIISTPTTPTSEAIPTSTTLTTTQEQTSVAEIAKSPFFGNTTSSASSIFGSAVAAQSSSTSPKATQSDSIFSTSNVSTTSSVFGTSTSVFGTATTNSVFAAPTSSVFSSTESKPSVFSTPAPATPSSVFASAITTTQSVFGGSAVFATTAPVFGTSSTFGTTTTQSIFGGSNTTSVFGASSSVFGGSTATTAQSVFGAAAAATTTTTQSVFGAPAVTPTSSVFGGGSSVFGSSSTTASVFGSPTTTQAFGAPTTQASIFGAPAATPSVFATPATTDQTGSLFGSGEGNLFAAASISTTSAPSQTNAGNIFGSPSGSVFGGFGSKPASTQASSIFGGASGTAFGQNTNNSFWSGGNTSGGGFGSGFGQQATTQASSIFGGTTGGSFSTPNTGQPFGSPQQPSAFGTTQQQPAPAFGGSPGFGSKAVFGQTAAFSSPPSGGGGFGSFGGFNKSPGGGGFGAPASFGGGATFGTSAFGGGGTSPNKLFGGSSPAPGFGTPTQSNAMFESLATQNTLTFGNLAQQSPPTQQQPTFNTSPSFTGWRG